MTLRCSACGETKPLDAFRKNKGRRCKACLSKYEKQRRAAFPDVAAKAREATSRWRKRNAKAVQERERRYYAENRDQKRESHRRWVAANPERAAAGQLRYRLENPIKVRAAAKRWRQTHPEKMNELNRRWRAANPEKAKEFDNRKRVKRLSALANVKCDFTAEQWAEKKRRYNHRCYYCGEKKPLTQDHVVPVSKGGEHTWGNIVPACVRCNSSKNNRDVKDFWRSELAFV